MSISLNDLANRLKNVESIKSSWTSGSGTNGKWWKENISGLIIQSGVHYHPENPTYGPLVYPTPFKTDSSYGVSVITYDESYVRVRSRTNSQCILDTDGSRNSYCSWIAIGYLVTNRTKCLFKEVISYVNILK